MCSATVCPVGLNPVKLNSPISKTRVSKNSRITDELRKMATTDPNDWRTPLVHYLENPGHIAGRKVRPQALKYGMLDNTLYQ
jgi:hypothetical protein